MAPGRVVATAGHVDHGKSTLVLALTGTDPDRWDEEKRRGLTIDLGFAATTLPSGTAVSFVDVPGHVRFLPNMLAGIGGVATCLFVVDAAEGWKPQSEEHLRILSVAGCTNGVVALTKVGLVDADTVELARLEVADHLASTFLDGAEIVGTDAPTGVGLGELRLALDRALAAAPLAEDRGRARLWVDRAFSARGVGTIVTGTLAGGNLRAGDDVEVCSATPGTRTARIRGLQHHGADVASIGPGTRVAVNLAGVAADEVQRGDAVVEPGRWHRTAVADATLHVLASLDHDVSRRGAYVAYVGSGEHPVRLRVLGPERIAPGATGLVRMHLPAALPLAPGDRYVLRESGRGETIGGGEVLDVDPVVPAARAHPDRSAARVVAERGWVDAALLERLLGRPVPDDAGRRVGGAVVAPEVYGALADRLRAALAAAGSAGLEISGLDEHERAVLETLDGVAVAAGRASAGGADPWASHPFIAALEAAPFTPPTPEEAGAGREDVRQLVRRGLVVEQDGMYFAPLALRSAATIVSRLLEAHPDGLTVATIRDALHSSRKHVLPLLAWLDGEGITRRRGSVRIAGPRSVAGA